MMQAMTRSCILPGSDSSLGSALVVNIFGGPGSGKSVLASDLFVHLKKRGIEAACPEEHAKKAIWSGQPWLLDEQIVLVGRTWETIHMLLDKVDVILIDSPLLLCSVYAKAGEPSSFHDLTAFLHRRTRRINILLKRSPDLAYSTNGRRETADQALTVDDKIQSALRLSGEPFVTATSGEDSVSLLADMITSHR